MACRTESSTSARHDNMKKAMLIFGIFCIALSKANSSEATDELRKRFMREAPVGWAELRRKVMEFEGKMKRRGEPLEGADIQFSKGFTCENQFCGVGDNLMLEIHCVEGTMEQLEVLCLNPAYGFELKREKKGAPYTVTNLDRDGKKIGRSIEFLGVGLFASVWLDDQTLEWSLEQPSFHVEDVEEVESDGRVVAEMSFSSEAFRRSDYQIRRGNVVLDPERSWAVLSYSLEVMLDTPAKVEGEVTYAPDGAHFPIPERFVQDFRATFEGRAIHRRETVEFSDVKPCTAPPGAFTLSAFGFPEPAVRETSESDRRWFALIVAAATFFAAAIGLRMWANRRRTAS